MNVSCISEWALGTVMGLDLFALALVWSVVHCERLPGWAPRVERWLLTAALIVITAAFAVLPV